LTVDLHRLILTPTYSIINTLHISINSDMIQPILSVAYSFCFNLCGNKTFKRCEFGATSALSCNTTFLSNISEFGAVVRAEHAHTIVLDTQLSTATSPPQASTLMELHQARQLLARPYAEAILLPASTSAHGFYELSSDDVWFCLFSK
jgi:hypothetical protein